MELSAVELVAGYKIGFQIVLLLTGIALLLVFMWPTDCNKRHCETHENRPRKPDILPPLK